MPSLPQSIPQLDLTRYTEASRRVLYDLIKEENFSPESEDPEDPGALYSAEDAELTILYLAGRWFAQWRRLEVPAFEPEAMRMELLRIAVKDSVPLEILLHEC